jgi:hypothetical protein
MKLRLLAALLLLASTLACSSTSSSHELSVTEARAIAKEAAVYGALD